MQQTKDTERSVFLDRTLEALWSRFDEQRGGWPGRLSDSALATATAVFALASVDRYRHRDRIHHGLLWIAEHRNPDGGWGDTPDSPTNVTATVLCWSALSLAPRESGACAQASRAAEAWLRQHAGGEQPERVARAVVDYYGKDRTFSTPILMMCALAGRLGPTEKAWAFVFQLPFELSVFPSAFYRHLRLNVVSYALPALVAVGLARHRGGPVAGPLSAFIRERCTARALRLARHMQPSNGGYEEAIPLTAFVAMALVAAGEQGHPIVSNAEQFLCAAVRENGAWPIDTSLCTWTTVLAVQGLARFRNPGRVGLSAARKERIARFLLSQQAGEKHPLTFGGEGGWGWSDLPGAMPDADDTSGVLLALDRLRDTVPRETLTTAATAGLKWLLDLQNADGGIPTFSRGWGKLPFDRSCPDITAHALRSFSAWEHDLPARMHRQLRRARHRASRYLVSAQRTDGAWVPLWFGNQYAPELENPLYGTAQVLIALADMQDGNRALFERPVRAGLAWLRAAQRSGGGWGGHAGGPVSVEETALGTAACALHGGADAARRGLHRLRELTSEGRHFPAAPIGLYFAKLWYSEALYPQVFTLSALAPVHGPRHTSSPPANP